MPCKNCKCVGHNSRTCKIIKQEVVAVKDIKSSILKLFIIFTFGFSHAISLIIFSDIES